MSTTVTMPLDRFDEMREEIRVLEAKGRELEREVAVLRESLKVMRDVRVEMDRGAMLRTLFPRSTWPVSIRWGLSQDHLVAIDEQGEVTDHGRKILGEGS